MPISALESRQSISLLFSIIHCLFVNLLHTFDILRVKSSSNVLNKYFGTITPILFIYKMQRKRKLSLFFVVYRE